MRSEQHFRTTRLLSQVRWFPFAFIFVRVSGQLINWLSCSFLAEVDVCGIFPYLLVAVYICIYIYMYIAVVISSFYSRLFLSLLDALYR